MSTSPATLQADRSALHVGSRNRVPRDGSVSVLCLSIAAARGRRADVHGDGRARVDVLRPIVRHDGQPLNRSVGLTRHYLVSLKERRFAGNGAPVLPGYVVVGVRA